MLGCDRIHVSEGIDTSWSSECFLYHYWYSLNFIFQPKTCNDCYKMMQNSITLDDGAIVNVNRCDYRMIFVYE